MTVVLEPFNYLILVREKIISFVNALLRKTSNLKLGMSIAVRLEKPMESEAVEAFFNSPMCRIACELTEDEYMQHIDDTIECVRHWWFRLGRGNNEIAGDKNCCLWQCH